MSTLVKVQHKGQVTIPTRLRSQAGISEGDLVEASFHRGKIILTPKLVIERSKFPTTDDKYTPEQCRVIDARLAESTRDIKKAHTYGPFNTADEMIRSMKEQLKKRAAARKAKRSR